MSGPYGQPPADNNQPTPWDQHNPGGGPSYGAPGHPPAEYSIPEYSQPPYSMPANDVQGHSQPPYQDPYYSHPPYQDSAYYQDPAYQNPGFEPHPASGTPYPASGTPYPAGVPAGMPHPVPGQNPYGPSISQGSKGIVIGVVVGLILVLSIGAVAAAVVFSSDDKTATRAEASQGSTNTHSSASSVASPAPSVVPSHRPGIKVTSFASPDRIGTLRKSADQSQADSMRATVSASGLSNAYAVSYEGSGDPTHIAVIWGSYGSTIKVVDLAKELESFFVAAEKSLSGRGSIGSRSEVDPGAVGGKAQCGKLTASTEVKTVCGWITVNAIVGAIFSEPDPGASAAELRTILSAVVVKG